MGQSKAEFLEQFGGDYGYADAPRGIDDLRAAEFKRLEGVISHPFQFIRENFKLNLLVPVKMKTKLFNVFVILIRIHSFIGNFEFCCCG